MHLARNIRALAVLFALGMAPIAQADTIVTTFESVTLPSAGYVNNAGPSGRFSIDGHGFNNGYDPTYDVFYGWSISNRADTTNPSFVNQYSAITGSGVGGSSQYAVGLTFGTPAFSQVGGSPGDPGYDLSNPFHPSDTTINLATGTSALSIALTNTTYSYLTMKNGDPYGFVHAFGRGDFQRLDIRGYNALGALVGTVQFYLADYRDANSVNWSIVNTWQTIDLTSLAAATTLRFGITSSQNDPTYGVNPPAYFAADNFTVTTRAVPEPAAIALMGSGLIALAAIGRARRIGRP